MPKKYRYNKKRADANFAKKVKKVIKSVAERKYNQVDLGTSVSTSGVIQAITGSIDQGDYATQRNGNKIIPTSWQVRASLTGADDSNFMRLIIIQWHEDSNSSVPSLADLFENISGNAPLYSAFNRQNLGITFRVLKDKLWRVSSASENPELNSTRIIRLKGYKRLKPIIFNGSSTTATNHIYLVWVSDSTVLTHPYIEGYSLVNYMDV